MKKFFIAAAAVLSMAGFVSCDKGGSASSMATLNDTVSAEYGKMMGKGIKMDFGRGMDSTKVSKDDFLKGMAMAMGIDTANVSMMQGLQMGVQTLQQFSQLRQEGVNLNLDLFMKNFKEQFSNDTVPEMMEMQAMSQQFGQLMQRAMDEAKRNAPEAVKNREEGEKFAAAKLKEGFTKTASGLLYKVVNEGAGEIFKETDVVKVKYTGKLVDGTEFDSSKGEAVDFPVAGVVPGFKEALMMMKPGAKYEIVIPGNLGYGLRGAGQKIGPDATLSFEVETVGLAEKKAPEAAPAPAKK